MMAIRKNLIRSGATQTGLRVLVATLLLAVIVVIPSAPSFAGSPELPELNKLREMNRGPDFRLVKDQALQLLARVETEFGPESLEVAQVLDFFVYACKPGRVAWAERAVKIKEKVFGPDDPEVAKSLALLGFAHVVRYKNHEEGERILKRALAIQEKSLDTKDPDLGLTLVFLGLIKQLQSDLPEARALFERAVAALEEGTDVENRDRLHFALLAYSDFLFDTGDFSGAQEIQDRTLRIVEEIYSPEHPRLGGQLQRNGMTREVRGDFAGARSLVERSLAIREKSMGPAVVEVALSLGNLASLLTDIGDYETARPLYERAIAICEKDKRGTGFDDFYIAGFMVDLADLLTLMGDYQGARPLAERGLALTEENARTDSSSLHLFPLAWALKVQGSLLQKTGDSAAARPLFERALRIVEESYGSDHPNVADSLRRLGTLLEEMGDSAGAKPLLERAAAIREKNFGPRHPLVAESQNDLAKLRWMEGKPASALDLVLRAEEIGREYQRLTSRALAERQALRYASVRTSGLELGLTIAAGGGGASARGAWNALVRSRALVLDEMAGRHRTLAESRDPAIATLSRNYASTTQRLANVIVRGPGDLSADIYRKLVEDTRHEVEAAERALAEASLSFRQELAGTRVGPAEVASALPPGSALIAFARYQRQEHEGAAVPSYLAFVLRSGHQDPKVVPLGSAGEIEPLISGWSQEASCPRGSEIDYRAGGQALREKVWDPLASQIGDARRVFIVPDGALNLINFGALPLGDDSYLMEQGPLVHYLSSERDLVVSPSPARAGGILVMGGPAYDETSPFASLAARKGARSGKPTPVTVAEARPYRGQRSTCGDFQSAHFSLLPAASREAKEVAALWRTENRATAVTAQEHPGAVCLTGPKATEAAFKAAAPGNRVLHLATHGFFLGGKCESALDSSRGIGGLQPSGKTPPPPSTGENPLVLSGLALAGANHRDAAGPDEEDGILTAEEIAAMDLSGTEWAVLSACDTGIGEIKAGEGVFGLRRAFQVAGARTVIMSLWAVEDESARQWMKALYEGRLLKHLDTAEAVRNASLTVLKSRRARRESTHPFYWAGFVAAGDWR